MKNKIITVIVGLCATSIALSAPLKAQSGYYLYNYSDFAYSTDSPTACTNITFPTSVAAASNSQVSFTAGSSTTPCVTVYTGTNDVITFHCVVTLFSDKLYATDDDNGRACEAINNNTAVMFRPMWG